LFRLYDSLGDVDRAFEQAQKACAEREGARLQIGNRVWSPTLRTHPRYGELLPPG
jgi:hypothetical protein